ncbi:hypothetical protein SPI_03560 [Niveomyces insectorum RCEF 264]|uniref:Uncharacterized protein n=1 Tax=Niveomyces insectorum RCEF 264 TaxID=1081102 RepID=A0A167W6J2_9HYPO|nr:hypothetical protein SPI_03560 [Niveomyces insectorum RCEF 264]
MFSTGRHGSAKHSTGSGSGGGGGGRRNRKGEGSGRGSSSTQQDENRPPSPSQLLEDAQAVMRELQAQARLYREKYNMFARETRRLGILLEYYEQESIMMSTSGAVAQAARDGLHLSPHEIRKKIEQFNREKASLQVTFRYFSNASDGMTRLVGAIEDEVARMNQDIQNLRSSLPLHGKYIDYDIKE